MFLKSKSCGVVFFFSFFSFCCLTVFGYCHDYDQCVPEEYCIVGTCVFTGNFNYNLEYSYDDEQQEEEIEKIEEKNVDISLSLSKHLIQNNDIDIDTTIVDVDNATITTSTESDSLCLSGAVECDSSLFCLMYVPDEVVVPMPSPKRHERRSEVLPVIIVSVAAISFLFCYAVHSRFHSNPHRLPPPHDYHLYQNSKTTQIYSTPSSSSTSSSPPSSHIFYSKRQLKKMRKEALRKEAKKRLSPENEKQPINQQKNIPPIPRPELESEK